MIGRGADGNLDYGIEMDIPVNEVIGREPVPASAEGEPYEKGRKVTQPIEVTYDKQQGGYILWSGNHRVHQAELNGDKYIPAFVQYTEDYVRKLRNG